MSRIAFYEGLAGKLVVRAARLRVRRGNGLEDAHELRHLWAAINAGNSDPCDGGRDCTLDRINPPVPFPGAWILDVQGGDSER